MKVVRENAIPAELWSAYLATRYEVELITGDWLPLVIGQPAVGMEDYWQSDVEAFIVTAHNPFSEMLSAVENEQREAALEQQIRDQIYRFVPTKAIDVGGRSLKKWPDERGFLIFGATIAAAIQLAAKFQQHAIVRVPRVGAVECMPVNAGD